LIEFDNTSQIFTNPSTKQKTTSQGMTGNNDKLRN